MKKYIKSLLSHPLITGSTIIFIGSFLVNICNWLFNVIIGGRSLISPAEYGLYTTLMSLSVVVGVFSASLTGIFAKFSAQFSAKEDEHAMHHLLKIGIKFSVAIGFLILIFLLLATPVIAVFLHITDIRLILATFLIIFFTVLIALPMGILQGQMRFTHITILNGLMALLKIGIVLLFILIGLKVFGVMLGVLFSTTIIYIVSLIYVLKHSAVKSKKSLPQESFFKDLKRYSLHFFLATLGTSLLTNTDILLVRHFFSPSIVGNYAALSIMGKSIFYFISPIFFVFFPLIAQKKEKKENFLQTLFLALTIILIACLSFSFVYFAFPNLILHIFFPSRAYALLAGLLGPYALYITLFSLVTLLNSFLLSIGNTSVYKVNLFAAVLFIVLVWIYHQSLYQIIAILFLVSVFVFLCFLLLLTHQHMKKILRVTKEAIITSYFWQGR